MTRSLHLLTSATIALLMLPNSGAIHPFYQAFSPLKDAFANQFRQLEPFNDAKVISASLQPPANRASSHDTDVDEGINIRKEIHFVSNEPSTTVHISTSAPTSGYMETQTTSFNLNTFTFNRNNTRRVNDIFSVLADVEGSRQPNEPDGHLKNNMIPNNRYPSNIENNSGHDTTDDISKNILQAVKNIENVLTTMKVMKDLYHVKKINLIPTSSNSFFANGTAASVIDMLLDVPTLEGIRTAGLTARSEKEFLDYMASVLLGAETRSSALTLDPVTVIALLTLAAYLIRAVYQILTVTGRSLDVSDGNMNLALSDLPETLVRVHNWISTLDVASHSDDDRVTREVREDLSREDLSREDLSIPGDVAAVVKLHRNGHSSCVRQFLCQQLQYRPLKSLTLSDLIIGGISYYYGEPSVSRYIDSALLTDREDRCASNPIPSGCSSSMLNDANSLKKIFTDATEKLLGLMTVYRNWL